MADSLYDLLVSDFEDGIQKPQRDDPVTLKYLNRLSMLQLSSLNSTEPQSLSQSAHTTLLSIQALSSRSSKSLINSTEQLRSLETSLPTFARDATDLDSKISTLDKSTLSFTEKYSRSGENEVLDKRKKALLMVRNVDRVSDVLDLPVLLSSAINSATSLGSAGNANYASALDLHSHIKRLHTLYPDSQLLKSIYTQAEEAMKEMTSSLIAALKAQNIKLAGGMRTVGWLRRIAPSLAGTANKQGLQTSEGALGAIFLVCRLSNLLAMLEALEPLRELADKETEKRKAQSSGITDGAAWSGGQHTERYLKRYIEIFREQSFGIVSMFRSVFPSAESAAAEDISVQFKSLGLKSTLPLSDQPARDDENDPLAGIPSALTTFPLHLVELLLETLKEYMPNVRDKSSRESLCTQILYCAGSFGRLGGDFSMILALLEDENEDENEDDDDETDAEWVAAMKKHRVLAGRLESLASGKVKA